MRGICLDEECVVYELPDLLYITAPTPLTFPFLLALIFDGKVDAICTLLAMPTPLGFKFEAALL